MNTLQKSGGISSLLEAIIYLSAFIVYMVVLGYPLEHSSPTAELHFLSHNQHILMAMNLVIYVLFGVLLAVLVIALHEQLKSKAPQLSYLASAFGLIWVGLVIASGMISNIGLGTVITHSEKAPEEAILIWKSVSIIAEGLGGGNEIVGGIWMLLVSVAALRSKHFSAYLNSLGIFVGLAGIASIYPAPVFTEIFGLSQILWFIWMGVTLLRAEAPSPSRQLIAGSFE